MAYLSALARRHSLLGFFALAYAFSWGFIALALTVRGFPMLFPFGSVLAALVMSGLIGGWAGVGELFRRSFRWKVGPQWYAAALLTPVAMGVVTLALNAHWGAPWPSAAQVRPWLGWIPLFGMALVDAPLQEELGWRGYAMPRFSSARTPLVNTLLLGLLVAGWHLPVALMEPAAAVPYLLAAIASTVVTNVFYYHGAQGALLPLLYHSAANTVGIFSSHLFQGADLTRYFWLLATVNWVVAVIVVVAGGPGPRGANTRKAGGPAESPRSS